MSEKRFINATSLLESLELMAKYQPEHKQSTILGVCATIKSWDTVDAVEVVRCKDCIHSKLLKDTNLIKENPWRYYRSDCRICGCHDLIGDEFILVDDDFYCKYGKGKETKDARDQRPLPS